LTDVVRAGGGVVLRSGPGGGHEVLLVHRPKYDDWSLPKGKLLDGETDEDAALREVEEETGLACELGPELPSTSYFDRSRRPKVVRYWLMQHRSGSFSPHDEIDEIRWLPPEQAVELLSYDRDRAVVESALTAAKS
jgi:8-oxo-dGTP diphosphatase